MLGELQGKYDEDSGMMVHGFSYHGVPKTFKVIIQDEDGNLSVQCRCSTGL